MRNHTPLLELSEKLLYSVKLNNENVDLLKELQELELNSLTSVVDNDKKKLVFWINLYNAFYQILKARGKYNGKEIYSKNDILIAGEKFSLDEIEHGILRRNRHKLSLGLLPNPFTKSIIKDLAVEDLDYRIHFALNCGAESCPPIAFYSLDDIDDQLDMATASFLEAESEIDHEQKKVRTTALFKWFLFDFGGENGIREIFKNQLGTDIDIYKISYKDYSWEENLSNFVK
jgi:hypothetical protein